MKPITIALIVAILLIAGGAYYFSSTKDEQPTENTAPATNQPTEKEEPTATPPKTTPTEEGSYVDYSSTVIAGTEGTKILFFHAPWCPQCRALESSIESGEIPGGVTIIKVDYDNNQTLRQKYGVTIQTTLVRIDDNGNLVEKYVAYDEPTLNSVKSNLL